MTIIHNHTRIQSSSKSKSLPVIIQILIRAPTIILTASLERRRRRQRPPRRPDFKSPRPVISPTPPPVAASRRAPFSRSGVGGSPAGAAALRARPARREGELRPRPPPKGGSGEPGRQLGGGAVGSSGALRKWRDGSCVGYVPYVSYYGYVLHLLLLHTSTHCYVQCLPYT